MISKLNPSVPLVSADGRPSVIFRTFLLEVHKGSVIVGTGSPEGVLEAEQGQEYMDDAGVAGAIKYIKRDSDVSGDRTQGWILI